MKAALVICASGEGTNFEALVRSSRQGQLQAEVVGLIVNRAQIGAVKRAERLGIPVAHLAPREFATVDAWDAAMRDQLQNWRAEWVALAGFLARIGPQVLQAFPQQIVNSHPSLLPLHGGAGMYGDRVHQAVLAAKDIETGITVHLVNSEYDRGRVLAQTRIPVHADDTKDTLAERVKARELEFYPQVLNDFITGRLPSG